MKHGVPWVLGHPCPWSEKEKQDWLKERFNPSSGLQSLGSAPESPRRHVAGHSVAWLRLCVHSAPSPAAGPGCSEGVLAGADAWQRSQKLENESPHGAEQNPHSPLRAAQNWISLQALPRIGLRSRCGLRTVGHEFPTHRVKVLLCVR